MEAKKISETIAKEGSQLLDNGEETKILEEQYALHEVPVISCNSANRNIPDVPMLIPEINGHHIEIINAQRKRLGFKKDKVVSWFEIA